MNNSWTVQLEHFVVPVDMTPNNQTVQVLFALENVIETGHGVVHVVPQKESDIHEQLEEIFETNESPFIMIGPFDFYIIFNDNNNLLEIDLP